MADGSEGYTVAVLVGGGREEPMGNCDDDMAPWLEREGVRALVGVTAAAAWAKEGKRIDGVLAAMHSPVDAALLDSFKVPSGGPCTLRVVSNYGVGLDHINVPDCAARGIRVGNTPDVLSGATADMGWALLMAAARRIPEGDEYSRRPDFTKYVNMCVVGTDIHSTTLGVVGMGRIGEEVAKRGRGFGMRILYHNRSRKPVAEKELGAEYRTKDELLAEADHVVLCCPLTPETRGFIDAAALRRMKRTATLVNIARGPVVDTAALTAALADGEIFAAGVDVTDPEPLPRDHPLLRVRERLVIAPHRGSATVQSRRAMLDLTVRNLLAGLRGGAMPAEVPTAEKRKRDA